MHERISSFREYWTWSPKRWLDMVGVLATVGSIGGFVIWARSLNPPLPWWNVLVVAGGVLLLQILSFEAFHRVRVQRDELKPLAEEVQPLREKIKEFEKIANEPKVRRTIKLRQPKLVNLGSSLDTVAKKILNLTTNTKILMNEADWKGLQELLDKKVIIMTCSPYGKNRWSLTSVCGS